MDFSQGAMMSGRPQELQEESLRVPIPQGPEAIPPVFLESAC
jgi:hypothetical protein